MFALDLLKLQLVSLHSLVCDRQVILLMIILDLALLLLYTVFSLPFFRYSHLHDGGALSSCCSPDEGHL